MSAKREIKNEVFFGELKLKWKSLLYLIYRLYEEFKQLAYCNVYYIFTIYFYNNCHVNNKSHDINVLSPHNYNCQDFIRKLNIFLALSICIYCACISVTKTNYVKYSTQ